MSREADLVFCREVLPQVSRTFAAGIAMLPAPYEEWVMVAYLLCRVVDTVEDAPGLPWVQRRSLFLRFEQALDSGDAAPFADLVAAFARDAEGELARSLGRVLALAARMPAGAWLATRRWVGEMAHGMALYARRDALLPGLSSLEDESDLRRYCYFVAGTVGRLLTDLFGLGCTGVARRRDRLDAHAEGFGLLLQMTNIVKDVTDDHARGRCYLPRSFCAAEGIAPEEIVLPAHREAALNVVSRVAGLARSHLADASAYVCALPATEPGLRRFCLFPMLLARRTLDLAERNPAVVTPGVSVKVDRATVASVFDEVERLLSDDEAIRALVV